MTCLWIFLDVSVNRLSLGIVTKNKEFVFVYIYEKKGKHKKVAVR